jgi:hypothetical protein
MEFLVMFEEPTVGISETMIGNGKPRFGGTAHRLEDAFADSANHGLIAYISRFCRGHDGNRRPECLQI